MAKANKKSMDPPTSKSFDFEHKIFHVENAKFVFSPFDNAAVLRVSIGELEASLVMESIKTEFKIAADSHDGELLSLVKRSLQYVREIRPGDDIPNEILDGSASWSVEPHHLEIAKNRLLIQMSNWMTGDDAGSLKREELEAQANDPNTRERINTAVDEIAEELGLGKDNREKVLNLVDKIARELSYIEGLRERFQDIEKIEAKLKMASRMASSEKQIGEEVDRVAILIGPPIQKFRFSFDQVDAQTGEVVPLLKSFDQQVAFIRENRDDLHKRMMLWDEIIDEWDFRVIDLDEELRNAVRKTYQFVAFNFSQAKKWL